MTNFKDNSAHYKKQLKMAKKRAFKASGELLKSDAMSLAPVDTGQLKGSMDYHMVDENRLRMGTPLDHGLYQERGTGIHALDGGRKTPWVYPVIGQKDDKGRQVFRRTQGVKPKRFIEMSFKNNERKVQQLFEKYYSQIK